MSGQVYQLTRHEELKVGLLHIACDDLLQDAEHLVDSLLSHLRVQLGHID